MSYGSTEDVEFEKDSVVISKTPVLITVESTVELAKSLEPPSKALVAISDGRVPVAVVVSGIKTPVAVSETIKVDSEIHSLYSKKNIYLFRKLFPVM